MSLVIDASVALKWIFPEEHSEEALKLFKTHSEASVPDFFFAEIGSVLWQRVKKGSITSEEAQLTAQSFESLPLTLVHHSTRPLLPAALEIAYQTGATVYDSLYVALAQREGSHCITADRKLVELLNKTPLANRVTWIGGV